ncbi:MAG: DUF3800 domain-containing protein [Planctomycetes bacterium]|nr:DUF3800 domain-containing protein [Planctomycetota bacterium]
MNETGSEQPRTCHYFVDEAGDGTLFNKKKRVVVGQEGCSSYFILGVLETDDSVGLDAELAALRIALLADPYLAKVPSMQPERRKTAEAFHAKDDCAEVRREVYRLLMQHELRFFAVVRNKQTIVAKVQEHNKKHPGYRYHPNHLYDRCVSRIFKERLHKEDSYVIRFSRRGNRSRTAALRSSIEQARNNLRASWGIEATSPIEIMAANPAEAGGLQAVDYFLWALQRLYERGEERYWEYVAANVSLVHDVDDTRENGYGAYYTKKNPLKAESLEK